MPKDAENILIVDDHQLTADGLRLLLANQIDYKICGIVNAGAPVIPFISSQSVDIVILDLNLPDMNGTNLLAELVGTYDITVIILTGETEPLQYEIAFRLGARAVVNKADDSIEIIQALKSASKGEVYQSHSVTTALRSHSNFCVDLSTRQMAMLQFLAQGISSKEIGYRLKIAAPTVSFHLAELRRKLNVSGNSQIIDKARAEGLL